VSSQLSEIYRDSVEHLGTDFEFIRFSIGFMFESTKRHFVDISRNIWIGLCDWMAIGVSAKTREYSFLRFIWKNTSGCWITMSLGSARSWYSTWMNWVPLIGRIRGSIKLSHDGLSASRTDIIQCPDAVAMPHCLPISLRRGIPLLRWLSQAPQSGHRFGAVDCDKMRTR
jgi:hypothetical protein